MTFVNHLWHWMKSGGRPMAARVSRWRGLAQRIVTLSESFANLSDNALLTRAKEVRWRAKSGTPLQSLLPESYALVREAARRVLGQQHYLVQILGGIGLFEGGLAEMQTGEGKTLTATLPAFLRALPGRGCHVITVNDYLARRDAEQMGPVYERLGLTIGVVVSASEPDGRRRGYGQDITYTTSREIGFDFLRDRLKGGSKLDELPRPPVFRREEFTRDELDPQGPVQRGHYFALVDEADSVLIDDAGTPLIIGLKQKNKDATETLVHWCGDLARQLRPVVDFSFDPTRLDCELTNPGIHKVILARKPPLLQTFDSEKLYAYVEQSLRAHIAFQRGRDYVVNADNEITIVDEGTGRTLDGRKWQAGLHQAVESKENVPITAETGEAARVTVQTFFRQYEHLAGMTGTGLLARREFQKTYHLGTTVIPTHRPCIRHGLPSRVFVTQAAKRDVLILEIERLHFAGRALLIGTPSVHASESLGQSLRERGIACHILNALFLEQEAEIVSQAGQPGQVTIATNMAGRGTDIHLHDDVRANGGLHVIATEMHSSRRIDRQLIGRAARQGDPGSFQFWLSLEDELFRCLNPAELKRLQSRAYSNSQGELPRHWLRAFQRTQRTIEARDLKHRNQQLQQEKSRTKMCLSLGLDPYLELAE